MEHKIISQPTSGNSLIENTYPCNDKVVFLRGRQRGFKFAKILRGVEFPEIRKENYKGFFVLLFGPKRENCVLRRYKNFEGGFPERGGIERTLILKIGILFLGGFSENCTSS